MKSLDIIEAENKDQNSCASEEERYPLMDTAEDMFNFLRRGDVQ